MERRSSFSLNSARGDRQPEPETGDEEVILLHFSFGDTDHHCNFRIHFTILCVVSKGGIYGGSVNLTLE